MRDEQCRGSTPSPLRSCASMIASVTPSGLPASKRSAPLRSRLIAMPQCQRRSAAPVAPASSAGRQHRRCRTGCRPCVGRTLALARDLPSDRRPVVAQPAAYVERLHAVGAHVAQCHWRPEIVVVCSCRYSAYAKSDLCGLSRRAVGSATGRSRCHRRDTIPARWAAFVASAVGCLDRPKPHRRSWRGRSWAYRLGQLGCTRRCQLRAARATSKHSWMLGCKPAWATVRLISMRKARWSVLSQV
jgi:hypothetical protein